MKRSKKILILLGIFIVACTATFGVMQYEERKEQIKNSDEIILELAGDSVQSLSWSYEGDTLAFHRDEKWLYDEDETFPVDEKKIGELLEQFQAFGASFIIEEVEDYEQYGLDDPTCTINLTTEEQSYEILLGDYSKMDSQRYVSIGDGNVYLVKSDPMDYYDRTLSDMIDHDETPSFENATAIQFEGTENYKVTYEEDSNSTYCKDDVYFTQQDGKNMPLDTSRVNSYLSHISSLDLTDYVTYNATDSELESYGLDVPELTVMIDYTEEEESGEKTANAFVLHIGLNKEEKEAAEQTAEDDDNLGEAITAYVRVGESQIVYQISSTDYDDLIAASYDSLRHLEVLSADFEDIYQVDISLEGVDYTIAAEENEDERVWYYQEEQLEIGDFRRALMNINASSFTGENQTQQEEISLTIYLDNENYPTVQIVLYRYDGASCLAVVDGEPVSFVSRSDVVDLIEAVHAIVLN